MEARREAVVVNARALRSLVTALVLLVLAPAVAAAGGTRYAELSVAVPAKRAPNKSATFALALRIACANSRVFVGRPAVRTVPAGIFEAVVLRSVFPPTMFDGVAIAAKVSES